MIHKATGKTYELTNAPDEKGICQVWDKETNHTALFRFEELEYWKIADLKRRNEELTRCYKEGLNVA